MQQSIYKYSYNNSNYKNYETTSKETTHHCTDLSLPLHSTSVSQKILNKIHSTEVKEEHKFYSNAPNVESELWNITGLCRHSIFKKAKS